MYGYRRYGYGSRLRYYHRYGSAYSYAKKSSSIKRSSAGNSRAARQQRDAASVTINHVSPFTVTIKKPNVSSNLTEFNSGGIAISLWEMLRTSQFYNNYQPMFDQVRIEKCRVKATGSAASTGLTGFSSPTVTMAFDRNGLDDSQVENSVTNDQGACVLLSPKLISTYSSSQIKQWEDIDLSQQL